jgi:RHS repeat-associated protein
MKTRINLPFLRLPFLWATILSSVFCLLVTTGARAGLTLEMDLVRYNYGDNYYYYFFPYLSTNTTPPNVSFGDYYVTSPGFPTNGATALYHFDTNGFNQVGGGAGGFSLFDAPDFNSSFIKSLTNGQWSIFVTNSTTTNVYYFTVTANIDSNSLPNVVITFPTNGAVNVTNQPTFTWQGPTNYSDLVVYEGNNSPYLPVTQTSWTSPSALYQGINNFTAHYDNYSTTAVVSSIPLDNDSNPISSWVSTSHLQTYFDSQFTVGTVDTSGTSHTLVAHYAWDGTNADGTASGADRSGNGFDMNFAGSFGAQGGVNWTTDAEAGPGAIQFQDGDGNSAGYVGWNPTPTNLLSTLAGSFSVSCWINTTQNNFGWDTAPAYYGAGIVSADNAGLANDVLPIALTGDTIGFNTGGDVEDVTLNSVATVNDGNYHHIVVTRNQQTGQKIIYIDGVLDSFSSGTTNLLNAPQKLTIGALADASDPNATDPNYYNGYNGILDDLQIYSGVLSAGDVANLFANPGSTAANGGGSSGGHTNVVYYSFEDDNLFAHDFSGHGNDIDGYGWFGEPPYMTNYAAAGSYAVGYTGTGWQSPPTNLVATLAGSFSVSLWASTSDDPGNDSDTADSGAGMLSANSDQVIPMAQTGNKLAFLTGGGAPDTLHSATSINTGNYVHLVVTRDQGSGEKRIYVNGVLDASDVGVAGPLSTGSNPTLWLGMNSTFSAGFLGDMDEVQIYSGVLSDAEVAYLYNHPGTTVADTTGQNSSPDFNGALNTTNLTWTTGGDTSWFVETTNTYDSASAAQSGSVTNNQSSILSVTVTGPGTLTFYWSSIANDPNGGFNYEFDLDGGYMDNINGDTSWYQDGPFQIPAGQHTLSWTVSANGDTDPTQAGFLDQVSYVPATPPVITLNPFSQTNYPGYQVGLLANASGSPAPTWQWFEVGNANPISGATSALFIPSNSGTPAVAGSYYAVASNFVGSSTTLTATVTFVNALPPPDWTSAFTSPFSVDDFYYGCVLDSAGNIYAAAQFSGTNTIGTNTVIAGNGGYAAAIVKQSASGNTLWFGAITNGGNGHATALTVASAPGDGVYVAGNFAGTNWLGTNELIDGGSGSIFLAYFDASGSNVWLNGIGGTGGLFTTLNCLVSDPSGNVTLSGVFSGTVNFGGTNIVTASGQQPFLAQYNATGSLKWVVIPSGWFEYLACSGGRIYGAVMNTSPNVSVGTLSLVTDRRWTLAALNSTNGQALWLSGIGAGIGQGGPSVIDDVPGLAVSGTNVFLVGTAYGSSATFGSFTVTNPGTSGQYFARYDTNGTPQLAIGFGSQTTRPWAVTANASGNVYASGDFDTFSVFGSQIIAATPQDSIGSGYFSQAFVAKFDSNGNPIWARPATSTGPIYSISTNLVNFRGIALASDGVWVSGFGKGIITFGAKSFYSNFQFVSLGDGFGYLLFNDSGILAKVTDVGTPPVITQDLTNLNTECGSYVNLSVTATNPAPLYYQWYLYGTNLIAGATNASLNFYPASVPQSGGYSVVVADAFGSVTSSVAALSVVDTTPPVVTLNGAALIVTACPADFVDPGATAYDTCAGNLPVTTNGVVSLVPGTNILTYVATDPSGNSGTNTRTVVVVPVTNPPVISIIGANPMQVLLNSSFVDPGQTAVDFCGNVLSVTTSGSVNPNAIGAYTLTYTTTDANGLSTTNTRTVLVEDSIQCVSAPSGLISWWTADGNAQDVLGVHNGTLENGATIVPAFNGQAFSFNGVSSYVNLGNWAPGNAWTIEAWVNPSALTPGLHMIAGGIDPCSDWAISLTNGQFGVKTRYNVVDCSQTTVSPLPVSTNTWYHVVGTCDGSTARIYVNGVLQNSAPVINYSANTADVGIGGSPFEGQGSFSGLIDEVAVYNRALSATEIGNIYNASSQGMCSLNPLIFSFSPDSGSVGNVVTIEGTNFFTVSSVTFNGTPATFTVGTTGEIAAYVPTNAITGPITVVTGVGTAVTSNSFTVETTATPACSPAPSGLAGWWPADGNALDEAARDDGTIRGGVTYAPGEVGQAFDFDGTSGYVVIPASTNLNVGLGAGLTIEGWIDPSSVAAAQAMVGWFSQYYYSGVQFWISTPTPSGTGSGCLYANLVDTDGTFHPFASAPGLVVSNTFQHVGLTYDNSSGLASLYLNGALVAQQNLGIFTPQTSYNLYFGVNPPASDYWAGLMDEFSIYNRSLAPEEIGAIYNAGSTGKCPSAPGIISQPASVALNENFNAVFSVTANGTPPLIYQWYKGSQPLGNNAHVSGATNQTLTLTRVTSADAGEYWVAITNAFGSTNSAEALLTVTNVFDLQLLGVTGPPQAVSGRSMEINWSVTNQGGADYNGTFHDQVFLSPNADGSDSVYYATFNFSGIIHAGQAVSLSAFITPNLNLSGNQWIVINTDANAQAPGGNDDTNNTAVSVNPVNILLEPLPALQVAYVNVPPSAFAGQPVTITWGVTNAGSGGTSDTRWNDGVWLSTDGLIDNTATFLGNVPNASFLNAGDSYVSSLTVTLPLQIQGNYYFVVKTDDGLNVTERQRTNDTLAGGPTLVQIPPLPALVASITAPPVAFSGQSALISWTVNNGGAGATIQSSWLDSIYLSPTNVFDSNAVLLNYVEHNGALISGGGYSVTNFQVALPVGISGNYYFLVVADSGQQVYQLSREQDTAASSPATEVLLTPPPDLAAEQITAPGTIYSAHSFFVTNVVANVGASATPNSSWYDNYYLSPTTNFNFNTAIYLNSYEHYSALQAGQSYTNIVSFTVPNGLSGTFYLFVDVDAGNQVFELNKANNIGFDPTPILALAPLPDLVVTSLNAPATVSPGSGISVSWTVQNQGAIDTAASQWNDAVLLSTSPSGSSSITLGYFGHYGLLNPGESYTVTNQSVTIPYGLTYGTYYLFVVADSDNAVYLGSNSVNQTSAPHAITLFSQTADLSVGAVSAPTNVVGGAWFNVSWAVTNLGPGQTYASYWDDSVYLSTNSSDYLSTNSLPLAQDLLLGSIQHLDDLSPGASYTNSLNVEAPVTVSGDFTLYVLTDSGRRVVEDTIRSNNVAFATNLLDVQMAPPVLSPDLAVIQVSVPAQAFSSQTFPVTYTVMNKGPGAANRSWHDAVYLSPDPFLDTSSALYLGSAYQSGNLVSGQQYTNTAAFSIPSGLSGYFYVFVVADAGNDLSESDDNDNVGYAPDAMQVSIPAPADLVVTSVQTPANSVVGQPTTISYTVSNQGANAAQGSWTDAVYLSTNGQWSANDVLIGYVQQSGTLGAGSNYTGYLSADLPGITAGNYYIVVQPDVLDNLNENLTGSHTGSTSNTFSIDVPQLTLGVAQTNNLVQSQEQFFKVNVPAGQTLSVALNSDSPLSANQLYVRYSTIPNEVNYDYLGDNPSSPDQQITIPATQAGWYYIMVLGDSVSGISENVSIEASLLQFSLNSITPDSGGNAGNVTVQLQGGQFNAQTTAKLMGPGGTVITGTPWSIQSSAQMYVTFNLQGAPTGLYDVQLTQPGNSPVVLGSAFTVTKGLGAKLSASIKIPGAVRPGYFYIASLNYENSGDEDLPAPYFVVTNSLASPMALTPNATYSTNTVQLLGIAQDGPAGVLRPGSQYTIPIYFQVPATVGAHTKFNFDVEHLTPTQTPVDWSLFLPPQAGNLPVDAWAAISTNIMLQAGPTMSNLLQSLANDATFYSQENQRVYDFQRLFSLELLKAVNIVTPSHVLLTTVDDALPSHNLRLSFGRLMPSSIDQRFQIGPFGRGWTHNFEYTLTRQTTNMVDIAPPSGSHRIFVLQADLTWQALPGDNGVLQDAGGGAFTLQELDGSISRYDSQGNLVSVQDNNGNQIALAYSGANLTSITHSDGQQMTLAYNSYGCISSLSDSAGQTTRYYYDSTGEHLTSVVSPGNVTNTYDYVPVSGTSSDHALQTITFPDGTHQYFTYDALGRLSSSAKDNNAELLRYGYDALGNIFETNALNAVLILRCGERGQILQHVDALGNNLSLSYDNNFDAQQITQPAGQTTVLGYDAQARLNLARNALGQQVTLDYTNLSRLSAIHNQRGMTTQFGYDARGNLAQTIYPDQTSETATYDNIGSATNYLNRRGQAIQYIRNSFGQITQKTLPDGRVITCQYDARGYATNISDSVQGVTTFGYDNRGYMTNTVSPDGRGFAFTYNEAGKRTSRTSFDGYTLNYGYDAAGRMASVSDGAGSQLVQYTYDSAGNLVKEARGNGTVSTYNYDAANKVVALTNYTPNGLVESFFNYGYDADGNCTSMTNGLGVTGYQYDELNQLTGVNYPGGRQVTYAYDADGNRMTLTDTGTNISYAVNSVDEYTQAGAATFLYDADGNLTNRTDVTGTTAYQYDAENHLTSVSTPANGTWQYTYDAFGRRTATTHNGVTTYYQLDPAFADVAAEYDSSGSLIARYNEGLGLLSRIDGSGNAAFYSFDAYGNTRELTGSGGTVLNSYDYDAFGAATFSSETVSNEFQFVGRYGVTAEPTGLHFMKNRFYASDLGKFQSVDPIRFGGGLNMTKYVGNNPVSTIDMLGLGRDPGMEAECKEISGPNTSPPPKPIQTVDITGSVTDGGGVVGGMYISANGVQFYSGASTGEGNGGGALFSTSTPTEGYNVAVTVSGPGGAVQYSFSGADADKDAKTFIQNIASSTYNGSSIEVGPYIGTPGITLSYYYVSPPVNGVVMYALNYWGDAIVKITPKLMNPSLLFQDDDTDPSQALTAGDPNLKTGPLGYGPNGLISATQPISYTITFVNASSNTAPAHTITITDQLDPNLDPRTFRLTEIVFGTNTVQVPPNSSYLQTNLTISTADGPVIANVIASVDVLSGQAFWSLTAIDPATGQSPSDPVMGLLPPDDANGDGEGRVSYTVTPYAGLATGTSITNSATITFDINPPITTPAVVNMLDAGTPQSQVTLSNNVTLNNTFIVSWSGTDNNGESGLAGYNIYVSDNGGPFQLWLGNTTLTSATYTGQPGHTYTFYSIAVDNAGNVQAPPSQPATSIFISTNQPPVITPINNVVVTPDGIVSVKVKATDPNGDQLTYSLASGAPAGAAITIFKGTNFFFRWQPTRAFAETTNLITVIVTDNGVPPLSANQTFAVIVLDYLELSLGSTNLEGGQSASIPVYLASNDGVTDLLFTVQVPENLLTNWTLATTSPQIASATLQDFTTNILISLSTTPGQSLQGTQQISWLNFQAVTNQPSSFISLPVIGIAGLKPNAAPYSYYASQAGSVALVEDKPLLQPIISSNLMRNLILYGKLGTNYQLQFTTNLGLPSDWQALLDYTQTNGVINLGLDSSNPVIFYRLLQQ